MTFKEKSKSIVIIIETKEGTNVEYLRKIRPPHWIRYLTS